MHKEAEVSATACFAGIKLLKTLDKLSFCCINAQGA